ncbi:hypothetical protein VP275E431_P0073 [Vibrio phage 275E43-1]|nr:hypothetical protein VP275E431_P0073 [Vibrio phage 275E43-1]
MLILTLMQPSSLTIRVWLIDLLTTPNGSH